ncbi:MAG: rhodanese-like domain-containing protein [Magnetovibrionaceae bacterium]
MGKAQQSATPHQLISKDLDRMIIDVRKPPALAASNRLIKGARWRHPFEVDSWAGEIDRPVLIYCVHGHEVSQGVAAYLRARGLDALYLEGGFEGYVDTGGETEERAVSDQLRVSD